MAAALGSLVRRLVVVALCACGLAVYVARLEPPRNTFHRWSESRYAAYNATFFAPIREGTQLLDTETGDLEPLKVPRGERLEWIGFSNWVDDQGESVAAGRWAASTGVGGAKSYQAIGIGRFSLPSGRPLDRVCMTRVPASELCWYPRSAARVLFGAADGRLYRYDFPRIQQGDTAVTEGEPQAINWPNPPAGVSEVWMQEPTWPTDPRLDGRLFAVVRFQWIGVPHSEPQPHQIWWLRLDASGRSVVEAGRLANDEPDGDVATDTCIDERLPRVAPAAGGDLMLAYSISRSCAPLGELRVARITFDPQTHIPSIRHAESRKLVEGCMSAPAVFTPSSDALFALTGRPDRPTALRRIDRSGWSLPERAALALTSVWNR